MKAILFKMNYKKKSLLQIGLNYINKEYADFNKRISEFMSASFSGAMSLKASVNLAKRKGYRFSNTKFWWLECIFYSK